jgi:hypothetical protein
MSANPPPDRERRLRDRLKARAFAVLAGLAGPVAAAVEVSARDELHRCTLSVTPADAGKGRAADLPGLHFSAIEAAVYQCLVAAGKPLTGKQIAARISRPYDSRLRILLANLHERESIRKAPKQGWIPNVHARQPGEFTKPA